MGVSPLNGPPVGSQARKTEGKSNCANYPFPYHKRHNSRCPCSGGVLLVLILYKAPHSQVWVPESHSMNPPIAVLAPRLAVETGKSHPLWPLVFDFACTTADLAGASASSAAFFAITYWIISDEYFTSAMTWKARGRSLAVTSGTHFF
jgi:hypothetical protein